MYKVITKSAGSIFLPGGAHNLDMKGTDFVMISSGQDGNKIVIYLHSLTNS